MELANGAAQGRVGTAIAPDMINREAYDKARAQQLYAMNQQLNGQERQARIQVLSLVRHEVPPQDVVAAAEELWAFVTAGDSAPPEASI